MSCAEQIKDEENNVFFWFEDDWILYTHKERPDISKRIDLSVKEIESFFENDKKILLLTGTNYLNGRPHIFKSSLFDQIISIYKENRLLDPEIVMMKSKRNVFEDKTLRQHITDNRICSCIPLFTDVGIRWRKNRNIQKINRFFYKVNWEGCNYTWNDYRKTIITIWRNAECVKSQEIKNICDESHIKYEEKVIGVDCSIEEIPSPSRGVLPYYSFYDLAIGSFDKCLLFLDEEINKKNIEDSK